MLYLIYSLSEKKYKLVKTALKFFDSHSTEVLYAFEEEEISVAKKVMGRLNQQRILSPGF